MNAITRLSALSLLLCLPSLGVLSGCTTTNAYTGEQQASKTTIGAGIGAITGDGRGALIGAGIGALAGGAVGNYMDREESTLRQQLQGTGVQVVRDGQNIKLVMPSDITFANNSSDINPTFYPTLNSVAIVLNKFKNNNIQVAGYTSNTGTLHYNQLLSEKRAQSVASYLIAQKVIAGRLMAVGYGDRNPIATNDTTHGQSLNRRVEITLKPMA